MKGVMDVESENEGNKEMRVLMEIVLETVTRNGENGGDEKRRAGCKTKMEKTKGEGGRKKLKWDRRTSHRHLVGQSQLVRWSTWLPFN